MGVAAIASLLLLILTLRFHPLVALLLVATATALSGGTKVTEIVATIEGGMGKTLGHIAVIIALGAMIGRMIDLSGGAESVANGLVKRFGEKRIAVALAMAGFGVAIPVFFEVAVIMLMPVAYGLARTYRLKLLPLAIPMCTIILVVHAMLPPHPGAIAVAGELHTDIGRMLMFGLPVAIATSAVVFIASKILLTRRAYSMSPDIEAEIEREQLKNDNTAEHQGAAREPIHLAKSNHPRKIGPQSIEPSLRRNASAPGVWLVIALIALPILLILAGTVSSLTMAPQSMVRSALVFLGIPYVALLVDVLFCAWFLGVRRGAPFATVSEVLGSALPGVAGIILITGAGGAFASVLVSTGIGSALAKLMQSTGLPVVVMGFLVTMLLRGAQGPTTVALMTTAGIISPMVQLASLNPNQLALMALAMGAGGMSLSHVNDAGFWIVTRMCGLSVADGLKTWTVLTTIAGFTALLLILSIWNFV
ncbi:transporter [Agrobacterium rhizogenes]|nr:transporter [Rhizobium rhizogenes]